MVFMPEGWETQDEPWNTNWALPGESVQVIGQKGGTEAEPSNVLGRGDTVRSLEGTEHLESTGRVRRGEG